MLSDRWIAYGFDLCVANATMSKDPSTKVGAAILRPDKTVLSMGWNGFASAVRDTDDLLNNREEKYKRVIHAEMNALLSSPSRPKDHTLFVWPLCPCERCAPHIIQSGISEIYTTPVKAGARWAESQTHALDQFTEAGIKVFTFEMEQ